MSRNATAKRTYWSIFENKERHAEENCTWCGLVPSLNRHSVSVQLAPREIEGETTGPWGQMGLQQV